MIVSKHIIPLTCDQLLLIVFVCAFIGWIYYTFIDFQSFGGGFLGAWAVILLIRGINWLVDHDISIGCKCDKK